jgi:hypothetical protein
MRRGVNLMQCASMVDSMQRSKRVNDPIFDELNALWIADFRFDLAGETDTPQMDTLTILASTDLTYYHLAEIRFFELQYICCPVYFSHAQFGLASSRDVKRLREHALLDLETLLYCITVEADSPAERDHFIAAARAEVTLIPT